jgi:ubiquinone/menaquinone biosynthesis C-methylase UbiE
MVDYSEINKQQVYSETDSFTLPRYKQFAKFMDVKDSKITILDIGCNTGRGGTVLREQFPNATIIGLDVVQDRLNKITPGIYSSTLCESITEQMSLGDGAVDYIVAGEVIEHIESNHLDQVLTNFNRILKKGGKLLMTTPNPHSFLVKLGKDSVFNDPSHLSIMSIDTLTSLLKKNGFSEVKILGSGKASEYIPDWVPVMGFFGSYLSIAVKN